jgi:hypothetical protein
VAKLFVFFIHLILKASRTLKQRSVGSRHGGGVSREGIRSVIAVIVPRASNPIIPWHREERLKSPTSTSTAVLLPHDDLCTNKNMAEVLSNVPCFFSLQA